MLHFSLNGTSRGVESIWESQQAFHSRKFSVSVVKFSKLCCFSEIEEFRLTGTCTAATWFFRTVWQGELNVFTSPIMLHIKWINQYPIWCVLIWLDITAGFQTKENRILVIPKFVWAFRYSRENFYLFNEIYNCSKNIPLQSRNRSGKHYSKYSVIL